MVFIAHLSADSVTSLERIAGSATSHKNVHGAQKQPRAKKIGQ